MPSQTYVAPTTKYLIKYNKALHGSYENYLLTYVAQDHDLSTWVVNHGGEKIDMTRLLNNLQDFLPIDANELLISYVTTIRSNNLTEWLYQFIYELSLHWLDESGRLKPIFLQVFAQHRLHFFDTHISKLSDELNSLGDKNSTQAQAKQKKIVRYTELRNQDITEFLYGENGCEQEKIKNVSLTTISGFATAIGMLLQGQFATKFKPEAQSDFIELPFHGFDFEKVANIEKITKDELVPNISGFAGRWLRGDDHENQITLVKLQAYAVTQQAKLLRPSLNSQENNDNHPSFAAMPYKDYQDYLLDFLATDGDVAKCFAAQGGLEVEQTRLTNHLTSILPLSVEELWAEYKVAIDQARLKDWVYSMVDRVCAYWLQEDGKLKPEISHIFAQHRSAYFQGFIQNYQQELQSLGNSNSPRARKLKQLIASDERQRDRNIEEVIYGADQEKVSEVADKFISSVVMSLAGYVSKEFSNLAAPDEIQTYIIDHTVIIPKLDDEGVDDLDHEDEILNGNKVIISSFALYGQNQKSVHTIDLAKLQQYRQTANSAMATTHAPTPSPDMAKLPKTTASIRNTINGLSQLAFIGGGGLVVLGAVLCATGLFIPGLACIGVGVGSMGISTVAIAATQPKAKTNLEMPRVVANIATQDTGYEPRRQLAQILRGQPTKAKKQTVNYESSSDSDDEIRVLNTTAEKDMGWGQRFASFFYRRQSSAVSDEKTSLLNTEQSTPTYSGNS
jgi:hypothetical protein